MDLTSVKKLQITLFMNELKTKRANSASSRNRRLTAIRSFYKCLVDYELVQKIPPLIWRAQKNKKENYPVTWKKTN